MAKKPRKNSRPQHATYDIDFVRASARHRWPELLREIGGVDPDHLDGQHHPCPKCGGSDRFRFIDPDLGAVLCNQCFKRDNGDGFAALQWLAGLKFAEVLAKVADYLGVQPTVSGNGNSTGKNSSKEKADPAEHLVFDKTPSENFLSVFCYNKPPILPAAIQAVGGRTARYRNQFAVIALPVWGEDWKSSDAVPVGWCIYGATGGKLPKYSKGDRGSNKPSVEWIKVKLTAGSQTGIICDRQKLASTETTTIWKVEGPSDLLSFLSLPDLPPDTTALTNASGAGEKPSAWMLDLFRGKQARLVHDADEPGEKGATGWTDERGRCRPGWAGSIAATATECRHVRLPYEVVPTHGKDLRDWANEGGSYAGLVQLAELSEIFSQQDGLKTAAEISKSSTSSDPNDPQPNEADDDPHRLAKRNLDLYSKCEPGATIRFWRDQWFTWKPSRGCYRRITESDLEAKVTAFIQQEFRRLNIADQQDAEKDEIPYAKKVTRNLVTNVVANMKALCLIPSTVEMGMFIPSNSSQKRERRNIISMANGLIDLDAIFRDAEESEVILPHTPEWFSTIHLPYAFDPAATCPQWESVLEHNLEMDPERIKICQEWAGYLLTPDTGEAKFLALEGEGRNGKSVYIAGITAIVGTENASAIPFEAFGERFAKTMTLGRLVNICSDVGEIDKIAEGTIKSFVSGDRIFFDRKGIDGVESVPTARLTLAWNNRPRFSDRSSAIWRRMLLVPWNLEIEPSRRIRNMDKSTFWEQSGELPGMFMWALRGLIRLREQRGFTESKAANEAIEDYRMETNPARAFLSEHFEKSESGKIQCSFVYSHYCNWCGKFGHKPMGDRVFGREVKRVLGSERKRFRDGDRLHWCYVNIQYSDDSVLSNAKDDGSDERLFH